MILNTITIMICIYIIQLIVISRKFDNKKDILKYSLPFSFLYMRFRNNADKTYENLYKELQYRYDTEFTKTYREIEEKNSTLRFFKSRVDNFKQKYNTLYEKHEKIIKINNELRERLDPKLVNL